MTKKSLKTWSTIFGILGVVLGLFFALQYRILEDVSFNTASVETSPNWLLGIAVLSLFIFFAVICSALATTMPEAAAINEETAKKEKSVQPGRIICPICGTEQPERNTNCYNCNAKLKEEEE